MTRKTYSCFNDYLMKNEMKAETEREQCLFCFDEQARANMQRTNDGYVCQTCHDRMTEDPEAWKVERFRVMLRELFPEAPEAKINYAMNRVIDLIDWVKENSLVVENA